MSTTVESVLRKDLAEAIGVAYSVPERSKRPRNAPAEFEGAAIPNEVLDTVVRPLYAGETGDLVAVIETPNGPGSPVRIDIEYEDGSDEEEEALAVGYTHLSPGRWCVVDNEGNGHCMYASVRDAFLAAPQCPADPAFLSARTATGKETNNAYVQALRRDASAAAGEDEMDMYLHHYRESAANIANLKRRFKSAKTKPQKERLREEIDDAQEFAVNFKHMKTVAAKPTRVGRLAEYRKKLAAKTWGDEAAIDRLERSLGVNIAVIGPTGRVQNAMRRTAVEQDRPTVVLEHIPSAGGAYGGHYVLVARDPQGIAPGDGYIGGLTDPAVRRTGSLQTVFHLTELPRGIRREMSGETPPDPDDLSLALRLSLQGGGIQRTRSHRSQSTSRTRRRQYVGPRA
jgi:hypothetical protein